MDADIKDDIFKQVKIIGSPKYPTKSTVVILYEEMTVTVKWLLATAWTKSKWNHARIKLHISGTLKMSRRSTYING